MKELENNTKDVEIISEVQQEKKEVLIGNMTPHKGHKVFEYNIKENTILEASYEKRDVKLHLTGKINRKIVIKDNCRYCAALNKTNAIKRFSKQLGIKIKPLN